ncbi:hypothetical protein [Cellulomonas septica]|uniref:Uncharacterized protein n=1 Tax=Cellulomonas septica TaxID=285080 RepID=A0ABX1JV70_9CELL|nr:hypothetical protein [Cellulomonas septica]NKY38216.1 hypothetical protein [Cellulomonas septica]
MTNPRTIALGALALAAAALLVTLVASSASLWTSWPGAVVRYGGFVAAAAGLYALAARWDRRTAHD